MFGTTAWLAAALLASPLVATEDPQATLSKSTQASLALRMKYQIKIPESSESVYIRSVAAHHIKTDMSTIAWRENSGRWLVSQVAEDGPGGLLEIEPRLIPETIFTLSVRDSNKLDSLLRSAALYDEKLRQSDSTEIGATSHEMEIVSSNGVKFVQWNGRLKGKAGRVASIILNR